MFSYEKEDFTMLFYIVVTIFNFRQRPAALIG